VKFVGKEWQNEERYTIYFVRRNTIEEGKSGGIRCGDIRLIKNARINICSLIVGRHSADVSFARAGIARRQRREIKRALPGFVVLAFSGEEERDRGVDAKMKGDGD